MGEKGPPNKDMSTLSTYSPIYFIEEKEWRKTLNRPPFGRKGLPNKDIPMLNICWPTCFIKGKGVKKNFEQAAYWAKKAAEQGHPHAQYMLDLMFHKEKEVQQSSH